MDFVALLGKCPEGFHLRKFTNCTIFAHSKVSSLKFPLSFSMEEMTFCSSLLPTFVYRIVVSTQFVPGRNGDHVLEVDGVFEVP